MAPRLTKSIGTKVTDEDYEMLKAIAGERKLGDWVREVVFKAALSEPTATAHRTILGEVLALRQVLLNLHFAIGAGQPITHERMVEWIQEADAEKGERARAQLTEG